VTDKPLHTDHELNAIKTSSTSSVDYGRAVEASTVAKLAAAGDWEERWFRVLAADCEHVDEDGLIHDAVCGDCALTLAREAVAEVQAAHERELAELRLADEQTVRNVDRIMRDVRALIEAAHANLRDLTVDPNLAAALSAVDHLRERNNVK